MHAAQLSKLLICRLPVVTPCHAGLHFLGMETAETSNISACNDRAIRAFDDVSEKSELGSWDARVGWLMLGCYA